MNIKALKSFTTADLQSYAVDHVYDVDQALAQKWIAEGLAEEYLYIIPTGNIEITENGDVDVAGYATASVAVPVPSGELSINANGTYNVAQYASVSVEVSDPINLTVSACASDEVVLGKPVAELQANVSIANNVIGGGLAYVTGYTEFSSDPAEQSGNYIALKAGAATGCTITAELINAVHPGVVTLDSDGIIVIRLSNKTTQSIRFTASNGSVQSVVTLAFTDLSLEHPINTTVSNGSFVGATSIIDGETVTVTASANTDYVLPSTITVNGASYTYDDSTGAIVLSNPTGDVTISVVCEADQPVPGTLTPWENGQYVPANSYHVFDTSAKTDGEIEAILSNLTYDNSMCSLISATSVDETPENVDLVTAVNIGTTYALMIGGTGFVWANEKNTTIGSEPGWQNLGQDDKVLVSAQGDIFDNVVVSKDGAALNGVVYGVEIAK